VVRVVDAQVLEEEATKRIDDHVQRDDLTSAQTEVLVEEEQCERAEQAVEDLADLFRVSLGDANVRIRGSAVASTIMGAPMPSTHNIAGIVVADWMTEEMAKALMSAQLSGDAARWNKARMPVFNLTEAIAKMIGEERPRLFTVDADEIDRLEEELGSEQR